MQPMWNGMSRNQALSHSRTVKSTGKVFRVERDEDLFGGFIMQVEQLLQFPMEANYPIVLFVQTSDPVPATLFRIGVEPIQILVN